MEITWDSIKNLIKSSVDGQMSDITNRLSYLESSLKVLPITSKQQVYYTDEENDSSDVEVDEIQMIDFGPDIDELTKQLEELRQHFFEVEQNFKVQFHDFKEQTEMMLDIKLMQIDERINTFESDMNKMNIIVSKTMTEAIDDVSAISTKLKRDQSDVKGRFDDFDHRLKQQSARFSYYDEKIEQISDVVCNVIEIQRISLAMDIQDEQDRQSIALMGYQEKKVSNRPGTTGTTDISFNPNSTERSIRPGTSGTTDRRIRPGSVGPSPQTTDRSIRPGSVVNSPRIIRDPLSKPIVQVERQ